MFSGTEMAIARAPMGRRDRNFALGEIDRPHRRADHLVAKRLASLAAAFQQVS